MPVDGGKETPLVEGGQFGLCPSISRQGNRLVYSEQIHDTDIWRIDLPVSKDKAPSVTRLISSSQEDDTPHFSPDGKKIVFNSDRSGSAEIWACDSDGRNPLQLTSSGGPYLTGSPSWSPDGKLIAFDSSPRGLSEQLVEGRPLDLFRFQPEREKRLAGTENAGGRRKGNASYKKRWMGGI